MAYQAEHAIWSYYDGKGSLKRSSYKMTEEDARRHLPAGAIKVSGTEEIRLLPSNHIEEGLLEVPPPDVAYGCDARPVVDLIVCGAMSYNNVPRVCAAMDLLHKRRRIRTLIHRQASPLDFTVAGWAAPHMTINLIGIPIFMRRDGHRARSVQRSAMFSHQPHGILAFPGDAETEHILSMALEKNLTVWQPYGP